MNPLLNSTGDSVDTQAGDSARTDADKALLATLEGDSEAWRQIFEGKLQITQAYEEDRIYFSGLAPWRQWVSCLIRLIRKGQHVEFWEKPFFKEFG